MFCSIYAQEQAHVSYCLDSLIPMGGCLSPNLPEYIRSMGIDSTGFTKGKLVNIAKSHRIDVDGKFVPFGLVVIPKLGL